MRGRPAGPAGRCEDPGPPSHAPSLTRAQWMLTRHHRRWRARLRARFGQWSLRSSHLALPEEHRAIAAWRSIGDRGEVLREAVEPAAGSSLPYVTAQVNTVYPYFDLEGAIWVQTSWQRAADDAARDEVRNIGIPTVLGVSVAMAGAHENTSHDPFAVSRHPTTPGRKCRQ